MSEDKTGDVRESRAWMRLTRDRRCPRCGGLGIVEWKGGGAVVVLRALCECVAVADP